MSLRARIERLERAAGAGAWLPPGFDGWRTLDVTEEELRDFFARDEECRVEDWATENPDAAVTVEDVKAVLGIKFLSDTEVEEAIKRARQRLEWSRRAPSGEGEPDVRK